MKYFYRFTYTLIWITGIVIAKGFWSTFFAVITGGFWSLYLVVEKLLQINGIL